MYDKRRATRLEINAEIGIHLIPEVRSQKTTVTIPVNVFNISKSGMGFTCRREIPIGTFFNTTVVLWNKDQLDVVIKVVRSRQEDQLYEYGCEFVALQDVDKFKIEVYEIMFKEQRRR